MHALIHPDGYSSIGRIFSVVAGEGLGIARARMVSVGERPCVVFEATGKDAEASFARVEAACGSMGCSRIEAEKARELFDRGAYPTTAALNNCTLCIIRPHALEAGKAGAIISDIQDASFELSAMETVHFTRAQACELLEVYKDVVPYYSKMIDHIISSPCLALEVRSESAVADFRELCGPQDVELAQRIRPNTLRAKHGDVGPSGGEVSNAVHCTDLVEDGDIECSYVFQVLA